MLISTSRVISLRSDHLIGVSGYLTSYYQEADIEGHKIPNSSAFVERIDEIIKPRVQKFRLRTANKEHLALLKMHLISSYKQYFCKVFF